MSGFVVFWILVIISIGWVVVIFDEALFKPKRNTTPPVEKILHLVATGNGFKVYSGGYLETEAIKKRMLVDWTLEDTVTGKLTWFYKYPMCGSIEVVGEFEWMNAYEAKRAYAIIESIGRAQNKAAAEERAKFIAEKHNSSREAAKKTYESR
ncbi:hypothetical protein P7_275 [Pectobacterium phage vB_PcaM_P7_Pc]|nr:hypothetical protein P7_275 [Pectobacterium phage vB_PcaM_P7_Pc]